MIINDIGLGLQMGTEKVEKENVKEILHLI